MAGWNYIVVSELSEANKLMPSELYEVAFHAIQEILFSKDHGLQFRTIESDRVTDNEEEGIWHQFEVALDHEKSVSNLSLKFFVSVVVLNNSCKYVSLVGDTSDSDLFLKNNVKDLASVFVSGLGGRVVKIIADPYGDFGKITEMMTDKRLDLIFRKVD